MVFTSTSHFTINIHLGTNVQYSYFVSVTGNSQQLGAHYLSVSNIVDFFSRVSFTCCYNYLNCELAGNYRECDIHHKLHLTTSFLWLLLSCGCLNYVNTKYVVYVFNGVCPSLSNMFRSRNFLVIVIYFTFIFITAESLFTLPVLDT